MNLQRLFAKEKLSIAPFAKDSGIQNMDIYSVLNEVPIDPDIADILVQYCERTYWTAVEVIIGNGLVSSKCTFNDIRQQNNVSIDQLCRETGHTRSAVMLICEHGEGNLPVIQHCVDALAAITKTRLSITETGPYLLNIRPDFSRMGVAEEDEVV